MGLLGLVQLHLLHSALHMRTSLDESSGYTNLEQSLKYTVHVTYHSSRMSINLVRSVLSVVPVLLVLSVIESISDTEEHGPVACPCDQPDLCSPVSVIPEKEVFGFVVSKVSRPKPSLNAPHV